METKLANARKLIVSGDIDKDDFRHLKTEYVESITKLEKKLVAAQTETASIDGLLDQGIEKLLSLEEGYKRGELYDNQRVISAIYPENFSYDGFRLRTGKVNSVVHLIFLINKGLSENKKGQTKNKFDLSSEVDLAEHLSIHFYDDLRKLASM